MLSTNSSTSSQIPAAPGPSRTPETEVIAHIHELARTNADCGEVSNAILSFMITHFEDLVPLGEENSSVMPDKFKEACMVLLMSCKGHNDKPEQEISISPKQDFSIVIDIIKHYVLNMASHLRYSQKETITNTLNTYLHGDLESGALHALQRYTDNPLALHKKIVVKLTDPYSQAYQDTGAFILPEDIQIQINEYLSLEASVHTSRVSKIFNAAHESEVSWELKLNKDNPAIQDYHLQGKTYKQIFLEHPECRLTRYLIGDSIGENYFVTTLGCGPLTLQKVKNQELTLEEALERREKAYQLIQNKLASGPANPAPHNLKLDGSLACLMNDLLTINEICHLHVNARDHIGKLYAQKYLANGKLTLEKLAYIRGSIAHQWVQEKIDTDKMSVDDAYMGREIWKIEWVRDNVDMKTFTLQQALLYKDRGIASVETRKLFDNGELNIKLFEEYMDYTAIHGSKKKTLEKFLQDKKSENCSIS